MNTQPAPSARTTAILELLRVAEGTMPISAIHDRLPQDLRGSAQLTFQECQRLVKAGNISMESIPGGRYGCRLVGDAPAPAAPVNGDESKPVETTEEPEAPQAADSISPAKQGGSKEVLRQKGADIRLKIVGLVRSSPWKSVDLAKALGMGEKALANHLTKLHKTRAIVRRDGAWHAGPGKPGAIAEVERVRKTNGAARAPGCTVSAALDQLEQTLRPPPIERLEVKLQVLERLSQLVDPTIAAVLGEIRADLAQ